MKLPTIELNEKKFIWDSRLREFRPEIVDLNWAPLPVSHSIAEVMDSAVYNKDQRMQKLCLLDALDLNDCRGMINNE